MNSFLFECKKALKKKPNWVAVVLSMLAISFLYFYNYSVAQNIHQNRMLDLENSMIDFPELITKLETELNEAEKNGEQKKIQDLKMEIKIYESMLEEKQVELNQILSGNWAAISEKYYQILNNDVKIAQSQHHPTHFIMDQPVSMFTMRVSAEENRILAETGIEPFIQENYYVNFHPTIYDHFTGEVLEFWERQTKRYGTPGFYFLYQMIQSFIIPFIILIGSFIFGNIVSSESTKKKRGMNFYAVLPISKRNIFLAKYFCGLLFTIGFVLVLLFIPLILSLFTSGIGNLKYPILIYDGPVEDTIEFESLFLNEWTDEFHFITLGDYFNQVIPIAFSLVIFMYSLYFLLSLFIKNPSINACLLIIGTYLGANLLEKSSYNPFTYIDIHRVVNREFAVRLFNDSIHPINGIIVLNLIAIILIVLSYIRFKRNYI